MAEPTDSDNCTVQLSDGGNVPTELEISMLPEEDGTDTPRQQHQKWQLLAERRIWIIIIVTYETKFSGI